MTISKDDTIVLDGAGTKAELDERVELLQASIEACTSEYEKEKLQERLAKLSGGVAVIKVGGATESEVSEKKDRVIDALNATRAAVEEGIVAGGGAALLHASKAIEKQMSKFQNADQRIGAEIVQKASLGPLRTIANNAGHEGAVVVGKLMGEDSDSSCGFDAQNGTYVNMFAAGIIDPTKVVRTALVDAASVAGLMTTTEATVHEIKDDSPAPAPAAGMGGGMGGMF